MMADRHMRGNRVGSRLGAVSYETDRNRNLVLIWLVQHNGFPGQGDKAQGAFREMATGKYAAAK